MAITMDETTTALLDYCDSIGDCCRGDIAAQTTAILSHLQMMRAQCETVRTLAINLEMSEEDSIARMRSGLYRNTAGAAIREAGAAETALRNLVHALRDLVRAHERTKEELTAVDAQP
jgi:hypothetical protein